MREVPSGTLMKRARERVAERRCGKRTASVGKVPREYRWTVSGRQVCQPEEAGAPVEAQRREDSMSVGFAEICIGPSQRSNRCCRCKPLRQSGCPRRNGENRDSEWPPTGNGVWPAARRLQKAPRNISGGDSRVILMPETQKVFNLL